MAKKANGGRVLTPAEEQLFDSMLAEKKQAEEVAIAEKKRRERRESFKSLIPERSPTELAQLVANINPLQSVRAVHPDHGEIVGMVIEVETLYNRKGAERGKVKGVVIPIACAEAYKGEVTRDLENKPIMDDFHVFQVQPEWIIELGNLVEPTFGASKKPFSSIKKGRK